MKIQEMSLEDARTFLTKLVNGCAGQPAEDSIEKLRVSESHLLAIMHAAATELRAVQVSLARRLDAVKAVP